MKQSVSDPVEWHIFESSSSGTSRNGRAPVRMGPFSSEEECRILLASLNQIPRFRRANLEIHKKHRRRERRFRMRLPVLICRAMDETFRPAFTVDISRLGARLCDVKQALRLGEVIDIRYGHRMAVFRVVWVGAPGTAAATHVGVECLNPQANLWDLDLSERVEHDPLLQEIAVARAVQRKLFPHEKPLLQTLDYAGSCIQARTVGGDYFDFLDLQQHRIGLVMADIAGKGVAAALLMANLHGSLHSPGGDIVAPADLPQLLARMNDHLYRHTDAERFVTLFFGCYDDKTGSLHYVNCGHTAPLLLRASGSLERLAASATVLGLFADWDCAMNQTQLHPGDMLSLFTDGIVEATGPAGEFGEGRLIEALRSSRNLDAAAVVRNVNRAIEQFRCGEQLQDDLTLVIARVL